MAQRRIRVGTIRIKRTVTVKQTRRVTVTPLGLGPAPSPRSSAPVIPAAAAVRPAARRRTVTRQYSEKEREVLDRVARAVDRDVDRPRDVFLCHAWADRAGVARELFDALVALGVDVWFSEQDLKLGVSLARQLDAGLRASRVGLVLVTPGMLASLRSGGFADQELGALLGTDRVIPVVHDVQYELLRAESPLLASRAGLTTEGGFDDVAAKIAESVLASAE